MTTQLSYDSSTIREELADDIFILSPQDTPLLTVMEHKTVRNTLFEWMVDDITTPTDVVGEPEGFQVTQGAEASNSITAANTTRTRLQNQTMISALAIDVSHTQRHMNEAGIEDEYSWQVVKKGLELLKQMEYNFHWGEYTAGSGNTAQRVTEGVIGWLFKTGWIRAAGGADQATVAGVSIPTTFNSTWYFETGTTEMTETAFHDSILSTAWGVGCDINATILFCGSALKRILSDFGVVYKQGSTSQASLARWNMSAEARRRIVAVDFYESDYGTIAIALDRFMDTTAALTTPPAVFSTTPAGWDTTFSGNVQGNESIFAIDPAFWDVMVLQPFQHEPIARRGNSTEGYVFMEAGVRCGSPLAGYGGSNLTAATA